MGVSYSIDHTARLSDNFDLFCWLFPGKSTSVLLRRSLNDAETKIGWLLSVGRTEESARSLRRLRGASYPEHQIHADVDEIAKHIRLEKELEGSSSFLDAFRGSDRRRTHIACGVLLWQVLSGISFINA